MQVFGSVQRIVDFADLEERDNCFLVKLSVHSSKDVCEVTAELNEYMYTCY